MRWATPSQDGPFLYASGVLNSLELLAVEAESCTTCNLAEGRTNVVFGAGKPDADLMFVGEGPGAQEDRWGLPFVGGWAPATDLVHSGSRQRGFGVG